VQRDRFAQAIDRLRRASGLGQGHAEVVPRRGMRRPQPRRLFQVRQGLGQAVHLRQSDAERRSSLGVAGREGHGAAQGLDRIAAPARCSQRLAEQPPALGRGGRRLDMAMEEFLGRPEVMAAQRRTGAVERIGFGHGRPHGV
jgi:hypothetical protein